MSDRTTAAPPLSAEPAAAEDAVAAATDVAAPAAVSLKRCRWGSDSEEEGEAAGPERTRASERAETTTDQSPKPIAKAVTPQQPKRSWWGSGNRNGEEPKEWQIKDATKEGTPLSRPGCERVCNEEAAQPNGSGDPASSTQLTANPTTSSDVKDDTGAKSANSKPVVPKKYVVTSFTGEPMPPGRSCRSVDCYEKLHKIDEGAYGVVYKARDRISGDVVALKQVKLLSTKEGFPVTALREINVLLSLSHPNVVNVREMVVGNTMDKIFMAMDYMEHDLKALMMAMKQPFSASEVKRLMLDLVSALEYCHEHWVLHRDLKSSNMLMNNKGVVAICDFGLARMYGEPLKPYTQLVVTLWYRAPELLLGCTTYGPEIDMWSLGCIFAELVLCQPLLPGRGELDQIDRIFKLLGTPSEHTWPGVAQLPNMKRVGFKPQPFSHLRDKFKRGASFTSETALSQHGLDLLEKMLIMDPGRRITAKQATAHKYFREQPPPKAHYLMPTMPSTHEGKGMPKPTAKSVNPEEEEQRKIFHENR